MMINQKYNSSLAKIFGGPTIRDLASEGESEFIRFIVFKSGFSRALPKRIKWREFFEDLYSYFLENYRNEYVYKNAIINKIILGRHSLNTSSLVSEFRVAHSKADIVILNGTSSVYEIKTAYDKLDRLDSQLHSYRKIFDQINIITDPSQINKVKASVNSNIGLFVLTDRYTIKTVREPKSNKQNVDPTYIIDSLRKNEYLSIIKEEFGYIPQVPNTQIHSEAKKLFLKLSPETAHDRMVEVLTKRKNSQTYKDFMLSVPTALKCACFSTYLNKCQQKNFRNLLETHFFPV